MYIFKDFGYEQVGKMIITLAPTGNVPSKTDNPNVPMTPEEIANETFQAYKLGVSVVHVHARDENGSPTYKKEVFEKIFREIRKKCPDIIICASTSGRVFSEIEQRTEVLDLYPDIASLTLGSMNFPNSLSINSMDTLKKMATLMSERNIMPELEIFESGFINTAKYLYKKGYLKKPFQFCLLLGSLGSSPANIGDLSYLVNSLPNDSNWSATGVGRFQTQINVAAMLMGGHIRIGLEDNIYYNYPQQEPASNVKLVERIVRIAKDVNREIATPKEARAILGLT